MDQGNDEEKNKYNSKAVRPASESQCYSPKVSFGAL